MPCEIAEPRDQIFNWLYGYEPLKVCHHPTTFGGHRHCGGGDVIALACHMISQTHMIKELCDFIGTRPSR